MAHAQELSHAPSLIRLPGPIVQLLLRLGLPLGPNRVLIIRGRRTGQPHHVPLAVTEVDGRRWVIGTFGETNWVRNLRTAGVAELEVAGTRRHVRGVELTPDERADFFRNVIAPYVARLPLPWRLGVQSLIKFAAPEIQTDPERAALTHPVFELVEDVV
jgi:deazaflavin-dependent oxidoreductase (nitroreductase family)